MRIVIAGGGKVGFYLAKTLLAYRHHVQIIEINKERCEKIADKLNIPIHNGDATKINMLRSSEAEKADIFIAVTGLDEENLIACQLAKNNLQVRKTIARVNNPQNRRIFHELGVDIAVSSTNIIADLIEEEIDYSGMKTLTSIKNNKIIISEIEIKKTSPVYNKKVSDVKMPKDCLLISVIKGEEVLRPSNNLVLIEGDSVIVTSDLENKKYLRDTFVSAQE